MSSLLQALTVALVAMVCLSTTDASSVAVLTYGDCPAVHGQATLDLNRYLGKWYEYKRFPAVFELGLQCTTATYGLKADGVVSVKNEGDLRLNQYVLKHTSIVGNATVPDPAKPAELSVSFFDGASTTTPNYFIQETDYENYSVIFSCSKLPIFNYNIQFAWILTRERGVAPDALSRLEANLTSAGVDVSNFFVVNQDGC